MKHPFATAALQHSVMGCTWSEFAFQGSFFLPGCFIVLKWVSPLETSSCFTPPYCDLSSRVDGANC